MAKTVPVAKAVVLDVNGSFLQLVRSDTHPSFASYADIPGGLIELNEEPGAAVTREIHEETGLVVEDTKLVYAMTMMIKGKSYPTFLYVVHVNETEPEITLSSEHKSYEWKELSYLAEVEPQLATTYCEALQYIRHNSIFEDI